MAKLVVSFKLLLCKMMFVAWRFSHAIKFQINSTDYFINFLHVNEQFLNLDCAIPKIQNKVFNNI